MLLHFPREIIEKILFYCDGRTLQTVRSIDADWYQIVQYLADKLKIWKHCCLKDIPKYEFLQYKQKWISSVTEPNWEQLYNNWLCWQDIDKNIEFDVAPYGKLNKQSSCICVVGNFTAVGFYNGCVRVFNDKNNIKSYRHLVTQVQSIHFVLDSDGSQLPSELLIAYPNKVFINDFRNLYAYGVFQNCHIFSTFKNFICGVSQEGRITIARVVTDVENRQKTFEVITFARIYSPDIVNTCTLFEGVCLILVNDKVKLINYKDGSRSSHFMAVELTSLQFSLPANFTMRRDVWIFQGKVIVTITQSMDIMEDQLFEMFILNEEEKSNSKKMFMPWETLRAFISCVYMYGNTLVIGMNNGCLYFYEIGDWKLFDIAKYTKMISVNDFVPILAIDAVESEGKRVFYVASDCYVYTVTGKIKG